MKDFEYIAPSTVEEAVAVRERHGERARVLAGGTDILVQLREGQRDADVVVDVKKIPELMDLSFGDGSSGADGALTLGAAVPCYRVYGDERVVNGYSSLSDASRIIGGWQIQGRASVGGNLCNSSPAADTIPALIVEGATCVIAGPGGRRSVPVAEFCTAPGRNVLADGEFLVALQFPAPGAPSGSRYLRFIPRNEMDIAVAGAGAHVQLSSDGSKIESARIALSAVAPTPVTADEAAASLAGKSANDAAALDTAADLARKVANPISDLRGPKEYRVHLAGVLVKRALKSAIERAQGGDRRPLIPWGSDPKEHLS
ncbi:MAG: xanthine dehydrogenase family protein subunit M [Planctomycetota bacterium]